MKTARGIRVSIVIPTFNRARLLSGAIDSALRQTAASVCEVIVVDDGSVDETASVAARYGARIRCVRQQNGGLAVARNTGIACGDSEFVALLDDDDRWAPEKIELQLAALDRFPEAVLATTRTLNVSDSGSTSLRTVPGVDLDQPFDAMRALLDWNFIPPSSALIRRTALESTGLFLPALRQAEDYHLWLRLATVGRFLCVSQPLTLYSAATPGSLSQSAGRQLPFELQARLLTRDIVRRPEHRAAWRRGVARLLAAMRDHAFRERRFAAAAGYGIRSLAYRPLGRPRWEWVRPCSALLRAILPSGGARHATAWIGGAGSADAKSRSIANSPSESG